jgi:hypothetical protein
MSVQYHENLLIDQLRRVIRDQTENIISAAAAYTENRNRGIRVHAAYTINLNTLPNAVLLQQSISGILCPKHLGAPP